MGAQVASSNRVCLLHEIRSEVIPEHEERRDRVWGGGGDVARKREEGSGPWRFLRHQRPHEAPLPVPFQPHAAGGAEGPGRD